MPAFPLKVALILYATAVLILTLLNLFFPSSSVSPAGFGYRLTDSFSHVSLNNRVLYAPAFQLIPGESVASLKKRIRQTYKPNLHPYLVTHGHSSNVPTGWIYTELTNPTATPSEVVLSLPQYRCSRATLFVAQDNRLDSVATFRNNTPLVERFFPIYQYSFPITVPPGQTTGVLLRTYTYMGFLEFDLKLTPRTTFTGQLLGNTVKELLFIFSYLLIGLVSLFVGITTPSPLMRTYGLMMLVVMLQTCFFYGYLSELPYPSFTSINSNTIAACIRFLLDASAQLFTYESFKPVFGRSRFYRIGMKSIIGVCVAGTLLHVLPPHIHPYLNVPINRIMTATTLVSLTWICYFSFVAYRRAGVIHIGLFMLVFIGDMVVRQVSEFLMTNNASLLKYPAPGQNPLLLVSLLTYLTIAQFRRELVTKRRMNQLIQQAQQDINAMRREEVERIGRDLHDQVGNTLASALGYLNRPETAPEKSGDLIRNAISELRFLSHNLVKDDNRPLTDKVQTLVSRFNDFSGIRFIFQDYTDQKINQLPPIQQQSMYSIVQELLTNIVRHSGASEAQVQFFSEGETMAVAVDDDGTGFDLATARVSGIGIQNMFKRAKLAHITLRFDPAPTGTSVYLTVSTDETLSNHSDRRPPTV